MPKVSPFTGLLFDPARAGPLVRVTAPPYDMITADDERRYHAASSYNVVRLILGRADPLARGSGDEYTRAAENLREWRRDRVLVSTEGPSWFPYEMRFSYGGRPRRVRGLICAVEVEPWGGSILPHERTLAAPVEDRLRLLRATRANLSAVYGVVDGPCPGLADLLEEAGAEAPARELVDEEGVEHRVWVIDEAAGEAIPGWLAGRSLLIADGHHRYTTALAYREEMRAASGPGPWDRMMMLVVDAVTEDPPVLPIHRVLRSGPPDGALRGRRVRDLAEVLATLSDDDLTVGSVVREDGEVVHQVTRLEGQPPAVRALHRSLPEDAALRFTPDAVAAEESVRLGRAEAAVFLPPTRVDRIRSVIAAGDRLPEKSTYFWPKPRTGMVIRPHE